MQQELEPHHISHIASSEEALQIALDAVLQWIGNHSLSVGRVQKHCEHRSNFVGRDTVYHCHHWGREHESSSTTRVCFPSSRSTRQITKEVANKENVCSRGLEEKMARYYGLRCGSCRWQSKCSPWSRFHRLLTEKIIWIKAAESDSVSEGAAA